MAKDELFSGESKNIEYKVVVPDKSEKYMKTVVAFANTQGGRLVIGIDDKTHKIIGNALKDLEEKGLIERSKENKDKRKTVVVLTEKGKEKAAGFKAFFTLKIRQMVDALGGEDFELMCNLIKKAFIATVSEVDKNAEIV